MLGPSRSEARLEDCHARSRLVINQLLHGLCQSPGPHNNPFVAGILGQQMLESMTVTK